MACKKVLAFKDLESIDQPMASAEIEAVPVKITQMQTPKKGKKRYFEGDLSDGKKRMRLVGFEEDQQKKLEEYTLQQSPVKLKKCEVHKSQYTGNLEVKLTGKTTIELSPTKFHIPSK